MCKQKRPGSAFALNRTHKDGLQHYCYNCHRDRRYGLVPGQYDDLMREQSGLCRICRQASDRELCVDHHHETGAIRGLLCHACNSGLGMFRDSPEMLARAIQYLSGSLVTTP